MGQEGEHPSAFNEFNSILFTKTKQKKNNIAFNSNQYNCNNILILWIFLTNVMYLMYIFLVKNHTWWYMLVLWIWIGLFWIGLSRIKSIVELKFDFIGNNFNWLEFEIISAMFVLFNLKSETFFFFFANVQIRTNKPI